MRVQLFEHPMSLERETRDQILPPLEVYHVFTKISDLGWKSIILNKSRAARLHLGTELLVTHLVTF